MSLDHLALRESGKVLILWGGYHRTTIFVMQKLGSKTLGEAMVEPQNGCVCPPMLSVLESAAKEVFIHLETIDFEHQKQKKCPFLSFDLAKLKIMSSER